MAGGRLKTMVMSALQLIALTLLILVEVEVSAQVHHVVGGDRGWDTSTDVASWSSGRIFSVGDKIWFTYSAAQEGVAELGSREEYESCDVTNPIRMYTDGIESIALEGEGARYFASFRPESCKSGLKLHVDVKPKPKQKSPDFPRIPTSESSAMVMAMADAPTTPSASVRAGASSFLFLVGLLICLLGV